MISAPFGDQNGREECINLAQSIDNQHFWLTIDRDDKFHQMADVDD
jgi:hypothetical protein